MPLTPFSTLEFSETTKTFELVSFPPEPGFFHRSRCLSAGGDPGPLRLAPLLLPPGEAVRFAVPAPWPEGPSGRPGSPRLCMLPPTAQRLARGHFRAALSGCAIRQALPVLGPRGPLPRAASFISHFPRDAPAESANAQKPACCHPAPRRGPRGGGAAHRGRPPRPRSPLTHSRRGSRGTRHAEGAWAVEAACSSRAHAGSGPGPPRADALSPSRRPLPPGRHLPRAGRRPAVSVLVPAPGTTTKALPLSVRGAHRPEPQLPSSLGEAAAPVHTRHSGARHTGG